MDRCPLLLKYKARQCYSMEESEFDPNTCELGVWTEYGDSKNEIWQLQMPDGQDFMRDSDGNTRYFYRFDFHVIGNAEPIIIHFETSYSGGSSDINLKTYILPKDYEFEDYSIFWDDFLSDTIRPILFKYERNHNEWIPPILVDGIKE